MWFLRVVTGNDKGNTDTVLHYLGTRMSGDHRLPGFCAGRHRQSPEYVEIGGDEAMSSNSKAGSREQPVTAIALSGTPSIVIKLSAEFREFGRKRSQRASQRSAVA